MDETDFLTAEEMSGASSADFVAIAFLLLSLGYFLFWLWMSVDCYRRNGGFHFWHLLFFVMPVSALLYGAINIRAILDGFGGVTLPGHLGRRIEAARRDLRIADTLVGRMALAELLLAAKQYAECEAEYRVVLNAEPSNAEALYHAGLCRLRLQDPQGALPLLRKAVELDRKLRLGVAWLAYTECLLACGEHAAALDERRKLARAYPRPLFEYAYAELLAERGENEQARGVLQEMLDTAHQAPREDAPWLRKGRALLRKVG